MHLPIGEADQRFFCFTFDGAKYECMAMPFDLAPAPQIATKFLQPAIRHLRRLRIRCVVYIDNIILMARIKAESVRHTQIAVNLLHSLGFGVHPNKIVAVPTHSLEFLGLQVNTVCMEF